MRITYLGGSPKGENSVTLQYMLYLKKKFPEHEYRVWNVGQRIKKLERDENYFNRLIEDVKSSDGIVWGFPLYALLLPSQYKRFIELIFEKGGDTVDAFQNKYTVALSTSIHFYDHACHKYIHAICDDLKMKYLGRYSADTWDILVRKNRPGFLAFGKNFFNSIQKQVPTSRVYSPPATRDFTYTPGSVTAPIDIGEKNLLLVADQIPQGSNLEAMVLRFQNSFSSEIRVKTFQDVGLKYPCLGCLKCSYENICVHSKRDGFNAFWNEELVKADIIVFAGTVKDRYLSAEWKKFFDRGYFMNHTPTLVKKQIGFLISGPLLQNHNLMELLHGFTEYQQANDAGCVSDEQGDSEEIDKKIQHFTQNLVRYAEQEYVQPITFLGEATQKIFRDDVYGRLRFVCQADHRAYKKNGYYASFPQRNKTVRKLNRKYMFISRFKKGRKKLYDGLVMGLVGAHKRLVADPNR